MKRHKFKAYRSIQHKDFKILTGIYENDDVVRMTVDGEYSNYTNYQRSIVKCFNVDEAGRIMSSLHQMLEKNPEEPIFGGRDQDSTIHTQENGDLMLSSHPEPDITIPKKEGWRIVYHFCQSFLDHVDVQSQNKYSWNTELKDLVEKLKDEYQGDLNTGVEILFPN